MRWSRVFGALTTALAACGDPQSFVLPAPDAGEPPAPFRYTEERAPCADRNPLRNVYFGDLHVHTRFSFDAYFWETRADPSDAYRFAKGEPIRIPPSDATGQPSQTVRLARALDFAAVTDHAEFLGEISTCDMPGQPGFDSTFCQNYRALDADAFLALGTSLTSPSPPRQAEVCDESECQSVTRNVWQRIAEANDAAYDRSSACSFTTLHGYEWSGNTDFRNLHRNVIFRNGQIPDRPVSYYDALTPEQLWARLDTLCEDVGPECQVLAIPHNSNLSNGGMFSPVYPGAETLSDEREQAALRARVEPLVETFQHKGNSECTPSISGIIGAPDELCRFEEIVGNNEDCGDEIGNLGILGMGCVSRHDYVRNALLLGMAEEERLGVNPHRYGFIGSTDTHNATAGAAEENDYDGHVGNEEDTAAERLGPGFAQPSGIIGNPGGLAGVWALENSRDGIFDALARRETFTTSGTRIAPRLFGGWGFEPNLCNDPKMLEKAYESGVPMGATLPARGGAMAPTLIAAALRDAAGEVPLQRLQIVKGWISANGDSRYEVFDVAGEADNGATVDDSTCTPSGSGFDSLCNVWTDPDFDPARPAFYYLRVVENPTCRWSWRQCLQFTSGDLPQGCARTDIPHTIQEMAWSSPIWYTPPS